MYNTEQKEQFLNTIANENTYNTYKSVFNQCSFFENAVSKDVADMTMEEVLLLLTSTGGKSMQSIVSYRSMLLSYVDWCIKEGKSQFSENNVSKIWLDSIEKQQAVRQAYLGSEQELVDMIAQAFPKNYDYNQEIYDDRESIIWLAYLGLDCEEIQKLKKTDIDYENSTIKSPVYPGITYNAKEISGCNLIEMLRRVAETDSIEYAVADRAVRKENLCLNDYVYRPKVGKYRPIDYDGCVARGYVWSRINKLNEAYENETGIYKDISIKTLAKSKSFIDYYNSGESKEYLESMKSDLMLRTPSKNPDQLAYKTILMFRKDYAVWKKAFH